MSRIERTRGGVYIDGFNLYHALDDLDQPHLKWLNLRRLAEKFSIGHCQEIEKIVFCTAFFPGDFNKRKRHESYNDAQRAYGVEVLLGHTTKEPMDCKGCGRNWEQPREKETDINVALAMFADAIAGRIDTAFLLSADTDQAASLRFLKQHCPRIKRVTITPPGRQKSKHLRDLSDANILLKESDIDSAILPAIVTPSTGRTVIRPQDYAPPQGWVHPDDRPS